MTSKIGSLLTITETIYHQVPDAEVSAVEDVYESQLTQDEEPYSRTYSLNTGDVVELDMGWLDNCSLVHFKNKSKEHEVLAYYDLNPSRVYQPSSPTNPEGFYIPPEASMRFYPTHPKRLRMSCKGPAKIIVTIFPE